MKKILFITNLSNGVNSFSIASVKAAKKSGLDFYLAGNFEDTPEEKLKNDEKAYGIKICQIDLTRSPYSLKNINAYKQLVKLIKEENIDYIHCNTPIGGLLGRLAGKKCNVKRVIYEAHGFHFYKGAPIKNWLIYYPIEKWLAKKTNAIITINKEDYERAKRFKLKNNGKIYYVPGVGMDLSQYDIPDDVRNIKRNELKLKNTDIALISMGDLIDRKNYPVAIETIAKLNNANVHYFICGNGPEKNNLKKLTKKLNIDNNVHFLGFRTDIKELLKASDIFLFTSKQEGLPRSLMEAMASGLPCIASRIRGNTDLIENSNCGFLCNSIDDYINVIKKIISIGDMSIYKKSSLERIKAFDLATVTNYLKDVYNHEFNYRRVD